MSLKVIGTGFGRTGTDSMREALEILDFGPCHHMRELIKNPEHERLWRSVVAGAAPDWDLLLGGYASCVDWPTAYYWSQLVEAFPQARVILTWRTAERLLVHRLGDGWGPLCAHLGVPVPDIPYPNSNSTRAFQNEFLTTPPA